MKIRNYNMLFAMGAMICSSFYMVSCDDETATPVAPDEKVPTVTINSPTTGAIGVAGSSLVITATIADDKELGEVVVTVGNGDVTVFTETITTFSTPTALSYTKTLSLPDDVVLGEHSISIVVMDKNENEATASVTIDAYPAYEDGKTTLMVTSVPAVTGTDIVFMVGQFQGWNPAAADSPLTKYVDSEGDDTYYIIVPNDAGADQGFKFVRGNDWPLVEKTADGKEVDNRKFDAGSKKVEFEIGGWRDFNPEVTNSSGGSIISIGGALTTNNTVLKGKVVTSVKNPTNTLTATYAIEKKQADGTFAAVAGGSGSLTLDGEGNFTLNVPVNGAGFGLGEYNIIIRATDSQGFKGREDKTLNIVEFPCADPATAVASTKTRFIINHPSTPDDIYITGNFPGTDIWGTLTDPYKLTKVSNTCAYIDIEVSAADKIVQFVRGNTGYTDWWRGQATNTAGSDAGAGFNTTAAGSGNTVKLYYAFWREEPAP